MYGFRTFLHGMYGFVRQTIIIIHIHIQFFLRKLSIDNIDYM